MKGQIGTATTLDACKSAGLAKPSREAYYLVRSRREWIDSDGTRHQEPWRDSWVAARLGAGRLLTGGRRKLAIRHGGQVLIKRMPKNGERAAVRVTEMYAHGHRVEGGELRKLIAEVSAYMLERYKSTQAKLAKLDADLAKIGPEPK